MAANAAQETIEYKIIFLQALREVIPSLRLHSDDQITKRIGKEKTEEIALDVCGYCAAGCVEKLTRNEMLALVCQVLKCLTRYMAKTLQIPVTINTIIKEIPLLEFAVNESFPGYAESGVLRYAIAPVRIP